MYIIVVGCGKMGGFIANTLSRREMDIVVIDASEKAFAELSTDFSGFQIEGDALETEILRRAKIEQADLLLVLTDDDNVNLTIAQIGKHVFQVPHTIARVFDPRREVIFQQLGIDTICPTRLSAQKILDTLEQIKKRK